MKRREEIESGRERKRQRERDRDREREGERAEEEGERKRERERDSMVLYRETMELEIINRNWLAVHRQHFT